MATKPNFTDARLIDGKVRVEGKSDDDITGLVDIRIVLVQDNRIAVGNVKQISAVWHAELEAGGFEVGDSVVVGIETWAENALTVTWTQPLEIK
jgi:hypothetical protein